MNFEEMMSYAGIRGKCTYECYFDSDGGDGSSSDQQKTRFSSTPPSGICSCHAHHAVRSTAFTYIYSYIYTAIYIATTKKHDATADLIVPKPA